MNASGTPQCLYFRLPDFLSHAEAAHVRATSGGGGWKVAALVVVRGGRVADANREAREAGVRRGQKEAQARQACPDARFVPYAEARWRARAEAVLETARRFSPTIEPDGEGAAWMLLGKGEDGRAAAARLAGALLPRLASEMLVGVGPNPWTARLAALALAPVRGELLLSSPAREDAAASARFARVASDDGARARQLAELPVDLLEEVRPDTAEQLHVLGLHTFGQVVAVPVQTLRRVLGADAIAVQGYCRGDDGRRLRALWPRPGIARHVSFPDPVGDLSMVARALDGLGDRLADALREAGQAGREIVLDVVAEDGRREHAGRRFARPRADESVRHALHLLWAGEIWPALARESRGRPLQIQRIEARVCELRERPWVQAPIWEVGQPRREAGRREAGAGARPRREAAVAGGPPALDAVVDGLKMRFPEAAVGFASESGDAATEWRERRLAFWDPYRAGTQPESCV